MRIAAGQTHVCELQRRPPPRLSIPLRHESQYRSIGVLRQMSQHGPSSALTPEELREQARRTRAHARHLVGDPGADRLLELASELEAQANAMDEPTVRVSPAIEPSAASGQSTCSRKAP
jgi:hypothetical protein